MPESVSAARVGCGGGSSDAAAMRSCSAGRGATSAVALHASVAAASHRLCITPAAALCSCLWLQPAVFNGYSANSTQRINCAGSFVERHHKSLTQLAQLHVCGPVRAQKTAMRMLGMPSVLQSASSVFVYSSQIPSIRCVTSRCVALNGCYSKGQQSAARAGRASRVARLQEQ